MKKRMFIIGGAALGAIIVVCAAFYIGRQSHGTGTTAAGAGNSSSAVVQSQSDGKEGGPAKPVDGKVHLAEYTNGDGAGSSVIFTGAIGDFGQAITINKYGAINLEHNGLVTFALSQGSFRIDASDVDKNVVNAFANFKTNPNTCSGNIQASGTAAIVSGSGTGAYQGISGNFDLTVAVDEIDTGCGASGHAYLAQALITTGSGNVAFKR